MRARKYTPVILCLLFVARAAGQTGAERALPLPQHNLMPVPASVRFTTGRLVVDKTFAVATRGHVDERLRAGLARVMRRLEGRTVMELPHALAADPATAQFVIECKGPGQAVQAVDEDEAYTLAVSDKQAVLNAPTVVGALRGLETFLQLLDSDRAGYFIPAVQIQDRPRFAWRGLLIDVARHFEPLAVLKRNLDAMAAVKLNVLHWHLTDDQGFRVESKKFPRLHTLGSDGLFYTQTEVREVVAYAHARGIRVVPEFDIPGHATAWLVGHSELGSAPGPYEIERQPGIFEPVLDPTREETYKLLDAFFGEMTALFPDAYLHIGGDENEGRQWKHNPQIQAFMQAKNIKDVHALQTYFNQRLLPIIQRHGKRMMGWDEVLQPGLPKDVVIHSWRGPASLAAAAKQGYSGILSSGYYIDLMYPASDHYAADPLPANNDLTSAQAALILGGEATMWGEWVSPDTIDSRIWPRTAAIAERLWSPRETNDVADMYRRLAVVSVQLEELGLTHERNQDVLLRRLARSKEIGPLQTLVSVVEPVKEYRRYQQRPQTMLSPLTGLIDAARADSEAARRFAMMVDGLLADAPRFGLYTESVRTTLAQWRDAGPMLTATIDKSPALHEAAPLAKDLTEIAAAGLEALSYLSRGVTPSAEWRTARLAALDEAAKPKAALEFAVIASVRQLVVAASELPSLKQTTTADWRARVKSLAAKPPGG